MFLAVGTSALVTPAALLPVIARRSGAEVVEINPQATGASEVASVVLRGTAAETLPGLVEAALAYRG